MIVGQQITDGEVLWQVTEFFKTDNSALEIIRSNIKSLEEQLHSEIGMRSNSTAYNKWDKALYPGSSMILLVCVRAGESSDQSPSYHEEDIGTIVEDGGVKWLICDSTDGTPPGGIRYAPYIPIGYIAANGSTVDRADYPRLVRVANKNNLWTEDPINYPGLFGSGDGETTMVIPDLRNTFIEGIETNPGNKIEAGLPNITGSINNVYGNFKSGSGMVSVSGSAIQVGNADISVTSGATFNLDIIRDTAPDTATFDASNSNNIYGNSSTVQPPTVTMIPIIRY